MSCPVLLKVFLGCTGLAALPFDPPGPAAAPPQAPVSTFETESPKLRQRLAGSLILNEPVGGILLLDLATGERTVLRPANAGRSAVHGHSEPDAQGRVLFLTQSRGWGRGYAVSLADRTGERSLFTGKGDPLWDKPVSAISFAPQGGKAAFVVQPPENEGQRFRPLVRGPLRIWDVDKESGRSLGIEAWAERPSWFPDGQRLAYVASGDNGEPVVRIVNVDTGADSLLAPGHFPIVSSDGKAVLVTRGRAFELLVVDVQAGTEKQVLRYHGLGLPAALIEGRYLIYKGKPTPGAPTTNTLHNSPFVGPKEMQAIKVMDLKTRRFTTLVPQVDPRTEVTALGHVQPLPVAE